MKKQINVLLSEKEMKKLEKIKNTYECEKTTETLRLLVNLEYEQIRKYEEMLKEI